MPRYHAPMRYEGLRQFGARLCSKFGCPWDARRGSGLCVFHDPAATADEVHAAQLVLEPVRKRRRFA
jgi:hypothetical protein